MSGRRKAIFSGTVLFITASVEEDVMFPPNEVVNVLLLSALSRAQHLHPMRICHFLFEGTHVHMIVVVDNPADVRGFMERFKTESAHYINRLLGKKKRTMWCEGYDSTTILTAEDVVRKISYIYGNPCRDNLEKNIERYPGLNSWKMFTGKWKSWIRCAWIHRPAVKELPERVLSEKNYHKIAEKLQKDSRETHIFRVYPDDWMKCFDTIDQGKQEEYNDSIVQIVKENEKEYEKRRNEAGKKVYGAERLKIQPVGTPFKPERNGMKTWCISSDIELRKRFIRMVRYMSELAREVYQRWKQGDFSISFPEGMFPPSMPKLVELHTAAIRFW